VLCIALRDFFKEHGLEYENWTQYISDPQGQPRLVLSDRQGNDRATLANLLLSNHEIIANTESKDNKMMAAYRGLRHEVFVRFSTQPAKAEEFAKTVFERIGLIFVILEPSDDSSTIFATLNDRGRQVDEMEKLRSIVTYAAPLDKQLCDFANQVWTNIETTLDDKEQRLFATAFGERNGFRTLRRRAQDEVRHSISLALASNSLPSWLGNLQKCLDIFSIFLNSPDKQGNARGLVRLEIDALYPLMLGIIEREGFDAGILTSLENVTMRLITYYAKPTARLIQLNFDSCAILGNNLADWQEKLLVLWNEKYSVGNQDFMEQLRTKRLYGPGVTRRRLLYLLERIENSQHKLGQFSGIMHLTQS
jgi:hypothetical protein